MLPRPLPTLILLLALTASACSDPAAPDPPPEEPQDLPGYPEVPRPSSADDIDQPDRSEIVSIQEPLAGKDVDFAPLWSHGTFTWDIDIQTQYNTFTGIRWVDDQDPPGNYWNGTRNSTGLVFEGGRVDLRSPYPKMADLLYVEPPYDHQPMPRRMMLVRGGEVVAEPYNPMLRAGACYFNFGPDYGTHEVVFSPSIFAAVWDVAVEPGFGQRNKKRIYHVGVVSAPPLTNPVYMKRERFWERVPVDGTKSVTVDPGASKTVTYTRTQGMSYSAASSFAQSLDVTMNVAPAGVGGAVSSSVTETFSTTRTVEEQESVSVSYQISGIEGKTVVFSVWQSVERYSFVDENGDPYTDPNYTFEDLGNAAIRGDHEVLQSAVFDYQAAR